MHRCLIIACGALAREIVALRKRDRQEREEEEQILELYLAALGEA